MTPFCSASRHRLLRSGIMLCLLLGAGAFARAAWSPVPAVSFTNLSLSQFTDNEIEVPYYLNHFAQVANAVVETGTNRGFLDIKVNREIVDNQPYNARIMEMQVALAYFYTADRPWNTYRGSVPVRDRLEAMLDRWCNIQNQPGPADGTQDGLFCEYSTNNWTLAPTGFGSQAAAQSLELIAASGLAFDTNVLDRARASLRAALMALFTRSDMRNAAKQYSNQLTGSYHAALIYLARWPDAQLETAFTNMVAIACAEDQSPAGFHYEQGGPDFGYSGVHERNLIVAQPRLRTSTNVLNVLLAADVRWNRWLAANYVPQTGLPARTYFANGGINTRTSLKFKTPAERPFVEFDESARPLAYTTNEYAAYKTTRRAQVQAQWNAWGALAVPSSGSYTPGFVYDAVTRLYPWQATDAQLADALQQAPYLLTNRFNRVFQDPLPTSFATVRRPAYYALFNSGNIRLTRQNYGLGLLWNDTYGLALQTVAATP